MGAKPAFKGDDQEPGTFPAPCAIMWRDAVVESCKVLVDAGLAGSHSSFIDGAIA